MKKRNSKALGLKTMWILVSVISVLGIVIAVYTITSETVTINIAEDRYKDIRIAYVYQEVLPKQEALAQTATPDKTVIPPEFNTGADFAALQAINPDIAGWIWIPDTHINYPVVQGQDNDRYLETDFNGKRSVLGTPFMDYENSVEPLDNNTVVHGHNMGKNRTTMFSTLLKYKDEKYLAEHPYIYFDTIYGTGKWRIVAAYMGYIQDPDVVGYMTQNFINSDEVSEFYQRALSKTRYAIEKAAVDVNTRFLTLSTCDRSKYGADGRFVVLAALESWSIKERAVNDYGENQ